MLGSILVALLLYIKQREQQRRGPRHTRCSGPMHFYNDIGHIMELTITTSEHGKPSWTSKQLASPYRPGQLSNQPGLPSSDQNAGLLATQY